VVSAAQGECFQSAVCSEYTLIAQTAQYVFFRTAGQTRAAHVACSSLLPLTEGFFRAKTAESVFFFAQINIRFRQGEQR
jgi:hypothetical protein